MFDIIVLMCAMGMEPQECQPPTAVDQVFLGSVPNESAAAWTAKSTSPKPRAS